MSWTGGKNSTDVFFFSVFSAEEKSNAFMPEFQADKRNYKEAARTNTESQQ